MADTDDKRVPMRFYCSLVAAHAMRYDEGEYVHM